MSSVWSFPLAVLLLALNGFFVAAEFALLAARRSRIERLAEDGSRAARAALAGIRELSLMLAGAQLGITMCSLGLGIVAEPALAGLIESWMGGVGLPEGVTHAIAFAIALAIVVFLHMVVGEMAPKSWAISHPEESALILARPFRLFSRVLRWAIVALNGAANALVRAVGTEPQDELAQVHSPSDLAMLLKESADHGLIDSGEQELLVRTLELRDIDARQAMTPWRDVVGVAALDRCDAIEDAARRSGRSRLLVTGIDGEVVGALHIKDVLTLDDAARAEVTAHDLSRPVEAVPASRDVESVMADLRTSGSHIALVIDEYGRSIGLLALEDVLEELIGDFADESDVAEPSWEVADGLVVVPGGWRIDEVANRIGLQLPHGEYDTVAGYVLQQLGRMPRIGDGVEGPDGARLKVGEMDGPRILSVAVSRTSGSLDQETSALTSQQEPLPK